MAGQFERYSVKGGTSSTGLTTYYWLLTRYDMSEVRCVNMDGFGYHYTLDYIWGIRPSMNLKSNVIITGGDGTKTDPFVLSLGS